MDFTIYWYSSTAILKNSNFLQKATTWQWWRKRGGFYCSQYSRQTCPLRRTIKAPGSGFYFHCGLWSALRCHWVPYSDSLKTGYRESVWCCSPCRFLVCLCSLLELLHLPTLHSIADWSTLSPRWGPRFTSCCWLTCICTCTCTCTERIYYWELYAIRNAPSRGFWCLKLHIFSWPRKAGVRYIHHES